MFRAVLVGLIFLCVYFKVLYIIPGIGLMWLVFEFAAREHDKFLVSIKDDVYSEIKSSFSFGIVFIIAIVGVILFMYITSLLSRL